MAFGTPSAIGTNLSTTVGAQTGNITSVTASAGDLVVVSGSIIKTAGSGVTVSISDAAGNTYAVTKDYASGPSCLGFIGWSCLGTGLSAQNITISISGGANWTSATAGASKVTGAASSSTNDSAANATTNAAAATNPVITSGTPANAGDIFFTTYACAGATTDAWTEDTTNGTWSTLYSKSGSAANIFAQSYQVNAAATTRKHQPTTTSRAYVQCVMAFTVAGGGSTDAEVGSSAGTSTVSGIGASTSAQVGSSAGVATASGIGAATSAQVGASAGVATVSGIGAATNAQVGATAGTSTALGVGASTSAQVGNAAGTSTALATTPSIVTGVGSAAGSSTALGVGIDATPASTGQILGGWGPDFPERKKRKWKPDYPNLREEVEGVLHQLRGIHREPVNAEVYVEAIKRATESYVRPNFDINQLLSAKRELRQLETAYMAYAKALQEEEDDDDFLLLAA